MATANQALTERLQSHIEGAFQTFRASQSKTQTACKVWVGCSGGLDSVSLLHTCAQWAQSKQDVTLGIIHVNHQLHPDAIAWQKSVESLAQHFNIECVSHVVDVIKAPRQSLEAMARDARYEAFSQTVISGDLLMLGQHRDDQLETLFLRLFRGSGPKGLAAMRTLSSRTVGNTTLTVARPFLQESRATLEHYATQHGLSWVQDDSNFDTRFDRNFIRQRVFPLLAQHWPERWAGMQKAMLRTTELCAEQEQALQFLLTDKLASVTHADGTVSKNGLLALPDEIQRAVLRLWLERADITLPSESVLQQILALLSSASDAKGLVSWQQQEVRCHQDSLYALKSCFSPMQCDSVIKDEVKLRWQDTWGNAVDMCFSVQSERLNIRASDAMGNEFTHTFSSDPAAHWQLKSALSDELYAPAENRKARKLQVWFKEWKVAPWYRDSVLGLFKDGQLHAVLVSAQRVETNNCKR
ncbi:tRNA lysidine(34) synthetase TilS [Alteromonas facilis]|uniref:tRNA lysidine(34) synthetase TilS n=1 Tax=Alteromonas facilis TaxID=2048004 RepID=UPI000C28AFC3|nr:tRNA lysidine(34) synthetase TilS [Alteromonas facilis]